jgi:taurine dioxygenase
MDGALASTLQLRHLHPTIGVEVIGIDLRQPQSAAEKAALNAALDEHAVLLFRDQAISDEDQLRVAELFGEVSLRSRPDSLRVEQTRHARAIALVTNIRENGKPIGSLPDGEMWFHHDGCFVEEPYRATLLYAVEVPSRGGNTQFINMQAAYERLDPAVRDALKGRTCLNIFDYGTTAARADPERVAETARHARHPTVIRHPHTGRPALYVNPLLSARIDGLTRAESDALLAAACAYADDASLIYEHVWRPGDLIVWDNWGSTHARTDFPADEIRLLRRSIVKGCRVEAA